MESGHLELFDEFEKSSKWLAQNFESIRKKYEGKFIALKEEEILAITDSFLELKEELKKINIDSSKVLVEYIPPKELVVFL